jgi:hypothetical protein
LADPLTLGTIGMVGSIAGAGLGAAGALGKAGAASGMYSYQAGIAQLNQKIALQNRDYAYATGETQAEKYGMEARHRMGAIRAGEGASGIDIGSGSKLDVQKGQQTVTDIDMAQIRNNAARRAYGYSVEASQDVAQSNLYTAAASDARSAGTIGAIGSLVSGSTSVADKWLQGTSTGVFASSSGGSGDPSLGA